ncbi:MAG TPA: hypothetical protein VN520_06665 [Streptomyces sp.]|uniref:hypothetical protein n=1 Tax=Streptomyces sp. TaxID=1931 RepID=UPI002BE97A1D|nr:hypothetical protein [Streptomyces sp.]HWU06062.1 hypothetical protein [Streptomyces sp.]
MTSPKSRRPNPTHQRRIARELRKITPQIGHQEALRRVTQAHELGLLLAVLDQAGIRQAAQALASGLPCARPASAAEDQFGLAVQPFTPLGTARLFAERYRTRFRHATGLGWLSFDGHRWEILADDRLPRLAAAEFLEELARQVVPDSSAEPWWDNSATAWRDLLTLTAATEEITVDPLMLDSDPFMLCTPEGLVDLASGSRRAADSRRDFATRCTSVVPDSRPTPLWDRFLLDAFGDGMEGQRIRDYLQLLLGYSLTGDVSGRVIPLLNGAGLGKSTLLAIVAEVMGSYAKVAPGRALGGVGATDLVGLRGARLIVVEEPPSRLPVAPEGVHTVQQQWAAPFQMRLATHVWFVAHHVGLQPESMQELIRSIPFTQSPSQLDPGLGRRVVQQEGPGVLQWMLTGARRYIERHQAGGSAPLAALPAPAPSYLPDPIGQFLEERCVKDTAGRTGLAQLRAAYAHWCEQNGLWPVPSRVMIEQILYVLDVGTLVKSNGRRYLRGLTLRE